MGALPECQARPCGKLHLELGGKLFDDYHASRVLPGFRPDSKVQMLLRLKDQEGPLETEMATHSSILAWRILMDRRAWWATVHGITKSQTRLK